MKGGFMKKMGTLGWIAFILVIVGALNWGLIGFFSFDLVKAIFGDMTALSRIIYALVGLSAIYMIISAAMMGSEKE
jgi:uncharacterized membrane protein YuzA (DUF378 family)